MAILAKSSITLVRVDDGTDATVASKTPPSDKSKVWLDISLTPPVFKRWDGSNWEIVNEISVGGRNFLRNTQKLERPLWIYDAISREYPEPVDDPDSEFNYAEFLATEGGNSPYVKWLIWSDLPILKDNIIDKDIVLTFEYQCAKKYTSEDSHLCIEYYLTDKPGTPRKYYKLKYKRVEECNSWQKLEFKETITHDFFAHTGGAGGEQTVTKEQCKYVVLRIYGNKAYDIKIRKPQLELGNKATDWSPNPQDINDTVDNINIGGRNLLVNSVKGVANDKADTVNDATLTLSIYNNDTLIGEEIPSTPIKKGQHFVRTFTSKYLGNLAKIGNKNHQTYFSLAEYKKGEEFTFSCNVLGADSTVKGGYALDDLKLERGNKATDWSPAPEDINTEIQKFNETVANITQTTDSITASVKSLTGIVETNNENFTERISSVEKSVSQQLTKDDITFEISKQITEGVTKVKTTTGFTFDENGLKVEKSNSPTHTIIDENGMKVSESGTTVLTANNQGVDARNLHATTYLIVGVNSRFEDFGDNRTGCFYVGKV